MTLRATALNGLAYMLQAQPFFSGEASDGARELEDASMGSVGEGVLGHGLFEKSFRLRVQMAVLADMAVAHAGVRADPVVGEAFTQSLP